MPETPSTTPRAAAPGGVAADGPRRPGLALAVLASAGQVVVPIAVQQTLDRGLNGPGGPDTSFTVLMGLVAALAVVLAGLLRRPWAWWAGAGLQALLLAAGVLHWSLATLGVLFGLVWAYVLYVRRRVLG